MDVNTRFFLVTFVRKISCVYRPKYQLYFLDLFIFSHCISFFLLFSFGFYCLVFRGNFFVYQIFLFYSETTYLMRICSLSFGGYCYCCYNIFSQYFLLLISCFLDFLVFAMSLFCPFLQTFFNSVFFVKGFSSLLYRIIFPYNFFFFFFTCKKKNIFSSFRRDFFFSFLKAVYHFLKLFPLLFSFKIFFLFLKTLKTFLTDLPPFLLSSLFSPHL